MRFTLFLVPFVVAAGCGGVISGQSDGGGDAATGPCNTNADCPNGTCAFPDKAGCSAHKQCFSGVIACKGGVYCACDGTTMFDDCGGRASKPVAHTGSCDGGGEPPPPDCGSGLACEVCDVTGFSVVPQSKPNDATNACSQQDIASFVTACLSASATQTTCSSWQQSHTACNACVVTMQTAAVWGPFVCDQSSCIINAGGCTDIVSGQVVIENGTNGSCGDLTNAFDECVGYACSACIDPNDATTCADDAEQAECKSYFVAAQTASVCALVDAGPSTCNPQGDTDWPAFINVFCGTGP